MGGSRREPGRPRRFIPHALKNRIPAFSTGGGPNVRYWAIAAPDVCDGTSAVGESRHRNPRRIRMSTD
jgi:hypothetical protein